MIKTRKSFFSFPQSQRLKDRYKEEVIDEINKAAADFFFMSHLSNSNQEYYDLETTIINITAPWPSASCFCF